MAYDWSAKIITGLEITHRSSIRVLSDHHAVVTKHPGLMLVTGARQWIRALQVQLSSQTETVEKILNVGVWLVIQ